MRNGWPAIGLMVAAGGWSDCGDGGSDGDADGTGGGAPAEWDRDVTPPADAAATEARAACTYAAGALPRETHGASSPNGATIPIDHILVMMMENRSFDHYFQGLPAAGVTDVDVAPANWSNPDTDGTPIPIFPDTDNCIYDTEHGWEDTHKQINGGKMDGFVTSNHEEPSKHPELDPALLHGRRAMSYHTEASLPFYYSLAKEFSIADRNFASVPGPTWPNRMFLYAATSGGVVSNDFASVDVALVDQLEQRGISWKVYVTSTPGIAMIPRLLSRYKDHLVPYEVYFTDLEQGTLPQFAFLDPGLGVAYVEDSSEHPPAVVQIGQRLVAETVIALTKSSAWEKSVLFWTYDEHGGLYDHVPPPAACAPDDATPIKNGKPAEGDFKMLGVRVPMAAISPYARKGYVSHTTFDHTSIVRFVQARFVLPALTARDANAAVPWDMFDFNSPPRAAPALALPTVPADTIAACKVTFDGVD